jgi:hypothetical protein
MERMKIFGVGLVLLLAVWLTGCTEADPAQVSSISATVKKLDLKSLGGVVCDKVYAPHGVGSTVMYWRTIGVRGAGQVPEIVRRLKLAGFKENVEETKDDGVSTYLYGPHQTTATVLSMTRAKPGQKFSGCLVPKSGATILVMRLNE